ncbi:unnamed protein product [Prorocentrum cordatum]|uniref:Uncharacterized protein n=1 Tax=Prorocentrum cordatum TaxID=2364126 RepID=A0ABN9PZC7_9DINO|nr:unnamed protein product [Polarella glacialis]
MSRRRDILSEVVLFARPERPSSTSRRVLARWKEEVETLGRANRTLLALRQLYRGSLDDSLLELADCWGQGVMPDNLDGDFSRRVLGEVRAAILRLRPAASAAGNQSRSTFKQRPVNAKSVSPRVAQKLERFKEEMLKEDGDACVQACEVRNYVDPHFRKKKEMLQLARRMALAVMLCRTAEKVDEVGLFCAVKKAELAKEEPEVTLRLVFDQRRSNSRWRAPPWRAMGGVSAMSFLDGSEEMKEDGVTMRFGTGDLPDFYYTLELGEDLAPYFVLPGVSGDELDAVLPEASLLPGTGSYVGVKVALMGFSWACWIAQTTMEDIFNSGPQAGLPSLSEGQRLAEGGPLPHLSRDLPAAHYEYIDDVGIIGLDYPAVPGQEEVMKVEDIWLGAKELAMAAGFQVHKDACSTNARMIGGDFQGTRLAPNQDKMWLAVFGIQEILARKWELPDAIVPLEVLRELAAAAAIAPLISVDLATPWDPTVMMFDASLCGGAIISTSGTVEEQRREGEAFRRVGDDVELGTRVRVPPVHACWDDITRWKEVVRWRWEEKEHINLLEMRTGVAAARHSARSRASWGRRHLRITDSMVCLGGFSKGRSASRPILILCRRMAALDLGCGMREYWRWVPSDRNRSDGPSRGFPIGQAPKERRTDEQVLPEKVAREIEALADVAEMDPFQPLRMGVSVPVKVLRFMHLCSGHTREGDLEHWLFRIAASRGHLLICANVDIGFGAQFDLTDEVNVRKLELLAEAETDGGHSGPSCATWSRVRFQPGGPPPLRLRHQLWGRPGLRGNDLKKVRLGSTQLLSSLKVLRPIGRKGGSVSLEHPADPGCAPFPSIFITEEVLQWEAELDAYRVTFHQCMWGCAALKLTTLTGTAAGMERFIRTCTHEKHVAYSSEFCRMLAECHVDAMLNMQERREAELTERAVEQLIAETLERRRRDHSSRACLYDLGFHPVFAEAILFWSVFVLGGPGDLGCDADPGEGGTRGEAAPSRSAPQDGQHPPRERGGAFVIMGGYAEKQDYGWIGTALGCYVPNVRRFLEFALEWNLPMMSREEIDDSVLCYLGRLVEDEEVGPHRGDFVVHGMAYVWPELSTGLPRSNRALRAWHRLHVAGEGGPQPLELWAVLDEAMRLAGNVEAADAAELALGAYLRSAELFALRASDIVVDTDAQGEQVVALRLGVAERAERAKTGVRQGALVDRKHVAEMLVRRKSVKQPADRVFACSVDAYRRALRRACEDIGAPTFPPHAARHSGPSRDAAEGYRTAWAI